jgi:GAF domain-containing protein
MGPERASASREVLAAETESARCLQQVATKLISAEGIQAVFEDILEALQAITGAHFASIQMFHPERGINGELRLLGHRGFSEEAANRWEWVSPATRPTCGEALRRGVSVVVPDVRDCAFMAGSEDLQGYLGLGIRAAQSLPLVSRSGALLGMVTTYWRSPHQFSATETRASTFCRDWPPICSSMRAGRKGCVRARSVFGTLPIPLP